MTKKEKTYGQIVAERWKAQYNPDGKGWIEIEGDISSEGYYLILLELTSLEAIECLVDKSWTRKLNRKQKAA